MKEYMDKLGMRAKDKVTGMEGVITSVSFDLYGCVQYVLTGQPKDGDYKMHWFDAKRLDVQGIKRVMEPPAYMTLKAGREIGCKNKPLPRA